MDDRRGSLLGRLRNAGKSSSVPLTVRDDVLRSLGEMLQTRLGSTPSSSNYGLPDLTDLIRADVDLPAVVSRSLKHAIEAYEPRLVNVRITHIPSPSWEQTLRFEVSAQLAGDKSRRPLTFETRIDPSKQVSLR